MQKCLENADLEIGVDEAGRGPLIGRVYAGAVIWGSSTKDSESEFNLITDSKKLSAKKRAKALEWIYKNVKAWGVGWAEPAEIDQINILEATKKAMDRAIENLKTKINIDNQEITLLIDGTGWEKKFTDQNIKSVKSIIKGDATYLSIAAASIIAKEHHDKYISELCDEFPELNDKYDLINNMGYGTKKHFEGLAYHGNSDFHRKTFKPCCNYN
jgi:ribonuclease HII